MDLFSQAFAFLSLNTKQEDLFEPLSEKGEIPLRLLPQTACKVLTSYLSYYENGFENLQNRISCFKSILLAILTVQVSAVGRDYNFGIYILITKKRC